jgi:hypothetical protein
MYFKSLTIKNFGPIEDYSINFLPKGLNIIVGNSDTGKTQMYGSLLSLIQGRKVLYFDDKSTEASSLTLISEHKNVIQKHEYIYQEKVFSCVFQNIAVSRNITLSSNTSQLLSLRPTFYHGELEINLHQIDITFIASLLVNEPKFLDSWSLIKEKYLSQLQYIGKEKIVITSRGAEQILKLLAVISYHSKLNYASPLILDEAFDFLDEQFLNFIYLVLIKYSQKNLVILFSQCRYPDKLKQISYMEFPLSHWRKENRSPIGYNYRPSRNKHLPLEPEKKGEKDNPLIVRYISHSVLKDEEYRFVEFKEIKGNNPTDSILSLVDQYVVAYLNENSNHRGRIFWGITDEERKVVGVKLNYKQRDELRKRISEKLGQIQPSLPPSVYRINIEKVYDRELNEIADLCIVEISVEPYQNSYLYSTSKGEVYIKTDGGKKKLSALELQQEILLRRKN